MTKQNFNEASAVIYGSVAGFEEAAARLNDLARTITAAPNEPLNIADVAAAVKALADHAATQDNADIKAFAAKASAMIGTDANGGPTFVGDVYNNLLDSFTALNETAVAATLSADGAAHFKNLVRTRQIYEQMGGGVASVSLELAALRRELKV